MYLISAADVKINECNNKKTFYFEFSFTKY
ncbi:hypothetical protein MCEMKE138_00293 [Candidatus Pelagibacterales bacterium]